MTAEQKKPQLEAVQTLRAFGSTVVVLGHIAMAVVGSTYSKEEFPDAVFNLFGGKGVLDLFFVFSGFIMVYISHEAFGKKGAAWEYFLMRLSRIVPSYWVYTALAILLGAAIGNIGGFTYPTLETIFKSFLFIPYQSVELPILYAGGMTVYPALVVGWTLNYEMLFYVLFALFMVFPLRRGLLAMTGLMLFLGFAHEFIPPEMVALHFWTSALIWKFAMGTWIGYWFVNGVRLKWPVWVVLAVLLVSFLILYLLYAVFLHSDAMLFHLATGLLSAVIVATVTITRLENWKAPRLLVLIGDSSYATYLCHLFVVVVAYVALEAIFDPGLTERLIVGLFTYFLALYCGYKSYSKLELPVMWYYRARHKRKKLEKEAAKP